MSPQSEPTPLSSEDAAATSTTDTTFSAKRDERSRGTAASKTARHRSPNMNAIQPTRHRRKDLLEPTAAPSAEVGAPAPTSPGADDAPAPRAASAAPPAN